MSGLEVATSKIEVDPGFVDPKVTMRGGLVAGGAVEVAGEPPSVPSSLPPPPTPPTPPSPVSPPAPPLSLGGVEPVDRFRAGIAPAGAAAVGAAADRRNADFPWDSFDSDVYVQHNYRVLRRDDREILELVRDFFGSRVPLGRGLDVGTGPNLYPALAMLPFCSEISMVEMSARNVAWLEQEVKAYAPSWDPFWSTLRAHPRYRELSDPRATLAAVARVRQGSVFDLPSRQWDVGTMFFVAESISARRAEFEAALGRFLGALRPDAPFAAAFMEHSIGYDVGREWFPAVSINGDDVRSILDGLARQVDVRRFEVDADLLREGYTGMILARGRAR